MFDTLRIYFHVKLKMPRWLEVNGKQMVVREARFGVSHTSLIELQKSGVRIANRKELEQFALKYKTQLAIHAVGDEDEPNLDTPLSPIGKLYTMRGEKAQHVTSRQLYKIPKKTLLLFVLYGFFA